MAPRRVLVMRPGYTAFVNELARMAAAARPVRLVRPEDVTQCTDLVRDAVDAGGRNLLCDNAAIDEHHMRPVAVVDCPREAKLVEGRHFGPIVAVVCCDDFADAMGVHERSDQRLATAIYTRSPSRVRGLAAGFGSGLVTINDCVLPAGHPAAPITGNGASGWGSSQGIEGLLGLTRPVVVSRTGRFLRLPLEVPTDRIQGFLRRFLGGRRAGGDAGTPAGDDGDARGRPPGHDPDSRSEESEEPTIGVH